jgi:hypothetical protein
MVRTVCWLERKGQQADQSVSAVDRWVLAVDRSVSAVDQWVLAADWSVSVGQLVSTLAGQSASVLGLEYPSKWE